MRVLYFLMSILTAMVGATINSGSFAWVWVICDFLLWPWAIAKWLICHELTLDVLKHTFSWFF